MEQRVAELEIANTLRPLSAEVLTIGCGCEGSEPTGPTLPVALGPVAAPVTVLPELFPATAVRMVPRFRVNAELASTIRASMETCFDLLSSLARMESIIGICEEISETINVLLRSSTRTVPRLLRPPPPAQFLNSSATGLTLA